MLRENEFFRIYLLGVALLTIGLSLHPNPSISDILEGVLLGLILSLIVALKLLSNDEEV